MLYHLIVICYVPMFSLLLFSKMLLDARVLSSLLFSYECLDFNGMLHKNVTQIAIAIAIRVNKKTEFSISNWVSSVHQPYFLRDCYLLYENRIRARVEVIRLSSVRFVELILCFVLLHYYLVFISQSDFVAIFPLPKQRHLKQIVSSHH